MTNDYVKGYLAALRVVENGAEGMKDFYVGTYITEEPITACEAEAACRSLSDMVLFIKDQRKSMKELVDKLNKENPDV